MKINIMTLFFWIGLSFLCISVSSCDPNHHRPTNHPCNFPDAETENDLRSPFSFKILDAISFENIVGTSINHKVNPDSVKIFDKNWVEIDPKPRFRFDNEWIFDNFPPYINIPFNDPQALLSLDEDTFFLSTVYDDVDTIKIIFNSCLVSEVFFNGIKADRPENVPTSASFYFKKKY